MMVEAQQVAFRFPPELLARLDAYVDRMRAQTPGLKATRADAARVLITKALDAEKVQAPKGKAKA